MCVIDAVLAGLQYEAFDVLCQPLVDHPGTMFNDLRDSPVTNFVCNELNCAPAVEYRDHGHRWIEATRQRLSSYVHCNSMLLLDCPKFLDITTDENRQRPIASGQVLYAKQLICHGIGVLRDLA